MQPCHSLRFARGASHNLKSHSTKSGRYLSSHLANTTPAVKDVVHVHVHVHVQQYGIIASLRSELTIISVLQDKVQLKLLLLLDGASEFQCVQGIYNVWHFILILILFMA